MKTIELVGVVNEQHQLSLAVPAEVRPGLVKIILEVPADNEESEASENWSQAVAQVWAADWSDPREDIYTLEDGKPLT